MTRQTEQGDGSGCVILTAILLMGLMIVAGLARDVALAYFTGRTPRATAEDFSREELRRLGLMQRESDGRLTWTPAVAELIRKEKKVP